MQVAVSLHHVGERQHGLGWRHVLPESWTKNGKRREEAGIPEEVVFKTKWQLSLDMIDQVRAWGLPNRIVVADAGYGDTHGVSRGTGRSSTPLCRRYFLNDGSVRAKPPQAQVPRYQGRGAPATRYAYGKQRPTSALDAAVKQRVGRGFAGGKAQKDGWNRASWPYEYNLAHGFVRGQPPHKEVWLLIEWPESEKELTE